MDKGPAVTCEEARLRDICHAVSTTVGVHLMAIILEHARWQLSRSHQEAAMIAISQDGASLKAMAELPPDKLAAVARDFVTAIVGVLGNLVGTQLAAQFMRDLGDARAEA